VKRKSARALLSLGFTPGSVVKMLENYNSGPVLVKVHDTAVALGRDLADHITVTRNETADPPNLKTKTIIVALAGAPNTGKSTVFTC